MQFINTVETQPRQSSRFASKMADCLSADKK